MTRRSRVLGVALLFALLAQSFVMTAPASASLTGPGVGAGRNITVFHNIDFVAVFGYGPVGQQITVDVIRNGVTIGTATGPTVDTPEGAALEVNHGVEGNPQPGDCWEDHTPDIQPGDRIVVTHGGGTDEVTVDDIRFTEAPFEDSNGDIVVRGIAKRADGTPVPTSSLDSAEFRDTSRFRGGPNAVVATPGVEGGFELRYHPPYILEGMRNTAGYDEAERKASLLGDGHAIGFGHTEELPLESMLVDGVADVPGPALGCEDSEAAVYAISDAAPSVLNAARNGGDLVLSGLSADATEVSVSLDDNDPATPAVIGGPVETSRGTFSVTIPAAAHNTLGEGVLRAVPSFTLPDDADPTTPAPVIGGVSKTVLKDTVAPPAPEAAPAGGSYIGSQSVALTVPEQAALHYTVDGTEPTAAAPLYTGPISLTSSQTLKSIAVDGEGNASPVRTDDYIIVQPTAPDAPTIVTVSAADAMASATWTPPAFDGHSPVTGYTVSAVHAITGERTAVTVAADATSATVSGLVNGAAYNLEVVATNAIGDSAAATSDTVTPMTTPGAPTIGTATAGRGRATVSWTPSASDGGSPITGYTVTAVSTSGASTSVTVPATHWSATVPGLVNGTGYRLQVTATNAVGDSLASALSNAVTPATTPGAPRIGTAASGFTRDRAVSARIRWSAPTSTGGARITGYTVIAIRASSGARRSMTVGATVRRVSFTGLARNARYRFEVRAENAVGRGIASARSNIAIAR